MKNVNTVCLLVMLGIFFGSGSIVMAKGDSLRVGLGVGTASPVYKQTDDNDSLLPMVYFRYKGFYVDGATAGFSLINSEEFQLDVYGEYVDHGYEASDSRYLAGMQKRKSSIDAGVAAMVTTSFGLLGLNVNADASSVHEGYKATLIYAIPLYDTETLSILSSLGAVWQDKKMVDYYYGVRNSEARPERRAYSAGSTVNGFVGMDLSYRFYERWELMASVLGEYFGEEIRNSPLVDKEYQTSVILGVLYRFW